jgi:preprotein translocase subunit SecA
VEENFEQVVESHALGLLEIEEPDQPVGVLLSEHLAQRYMINIAASSIEEGEPEEWARIATEVWIKLVDDKRNAAGEGQFDRLLHYVLLRSVDEKWKEHLHAMDQLRTGVGLRGYAQVDPKQEFKREGYLLFSKMLEVLREESSSIVSRIRIESVDESEAQRDLASTWSGQSEGVSADALQEQFHSHGQKMQQGVQGAGGSKSIETIRNDQPKLRRNDPCSCGSGKKFKRCCGQE